MCKYYTVLYKELKASLNFIFAGAPGANLNPLPRDLFRYGQAQSGWLIKVFGCDPESMLGTG